ncbi:hypothetical protein D3C72_1882990 [compost metagenome]
MVEPAILGFPIGRAGDFTHAFRRFDHQIIAARCRGRNTQLGQRLQNDTGGKSFVVTRFARHKGKTGVTQIVEYRSTAAATTRQANAVLLHSPGVALFPWVL